MERKSNNKILKTLTALVILALFFVLILFVLNGGLDTPQGVFIILGIVMLIIFGISKQMKPMKHEDEQGHLSKDNEFRESQNNESSQLDVNSSTETQPSRHSYKNPLVNMISKNSQSKHALAIGIGSVSVLIITVVLIAVFVGRLFAASPVGTWNQEGFEDRVTYYIYEDGTFIYIDNGEQSGSGYWIQTGNHVDLHWFTYYQFIYEDHYETTYYVIHGDYMTSGQVVLNRLNE